MHQCAPAQKPWTHLVASPMIERHELGRHDDVTVANARCPDFALKTIAQEPVHAAAVGSA